MREKILVDNHVISYDNEGLNEVAEQETVVIESVQVETFKNGESFSVVEHQKLDAEGSGVDMMSMNEASQHEERIEVFNVSAEQSENISKYSTDISYVTEGAAFEAFADTGPVDMVQDSANVIFASTATSEFYSTSIAEEHEESFEDEVNQISSDSTTTQFDNVNSDPGLFRSDSMATDVSAQNHRNPYPNSDLSVYSFSDDDLPTGYFSEGDSSLSPIGGALTRKPYGHQSKASTDPRKLREMSFLRQRGLNLPGVGGDSENIRLNSTPRVEKEQKDYVIPWKNMSLRHVERPELSGIYHQLPDSAADGDKARGIEIQDRSRSAPHPPLKKASSSVDLIREQDMSWVRQRGLRVHDRDRNQAARQYIAPSLEKGSSLKNVSWRSPRTKPKEVTDNATSVQLARVSSPESSKLSENAGPAPWRVSLKQVQKRNTRDHNANSTSVKAGESARDSPSRDSIYSLPELKPIAPKGKFVRDLVKRFQYWT